MQRYYYIYKITNLINKRIYIGKRTTRVSPENDNYLGSGKLIKRAVKKYGAHNFKKEIIEVCTKENLSEREKYYIELYECRNIKIGYNIIEGGYGVGDLCHDMKTYYNPSTDKEIRIKRSTEPPQGFIHGRRPFTEDHKKKATRRGVQNGMHGVHRIGKDNPFWGITYIVNKETGDRTTWHKKDKLPKGYDYCPKYFKQVKRLKKRVERIKNKIKDESFKNEIVSLEADLYIAEKDLYEYIHGVPYKKCVPQLKSNINQKLKDRQEEINKKRNNYRVNKKFKQTSKRIGSKTELKQLWKQKRVEFWQKKEVETCPYCGKQGRGVGFYRWHMDRCLNHPIYGNENKQKRQQFGQNQVLILKKNKKATTKGLVCITDGFRNKFIKIEDINNYPEYSVGMTKKKKS